MLNLYFSLGQAVSRVGGQWVGAAYLHPLVLSFAASQPIHPVAVLPSWSSSVKQRVCWCLTECLAEHTKMLITWTINKSSVFREATMHLILLSFWYHLQLLWWRAQTHAGRLLESLQQSTSAHTTSPPQGFSISKSKLNFSPDGKSGMSVHKCVPEKYIRACTDHQERHIITWTKPVSKPSV